MPALGVGGEEGSAISPAVRPAAQLWRSFTTSCDTETRSGVERLPGGGTRLTGASVSAWRGRLAGPLLARPGPCGWLRALAARRSQEEEQS